MTRRLVVAIDGPAGAGKTTVTQRVAQRLGYIRVDTGAMYRVVTLAAVEADLDLADADAVGRLARELAHDEAIGFQATDGGTQRVLLRGRDVTRAIRSREISRATSRVSAVPTVREALLDMQRAAGKDGGVVIEGRDIGTVVFPSADAKFFLTASVEARAGRRYDELRGRGDEADIERVKQEVIERDKRDTMRPIAPLRRAPDAIEVDSSELGIDEVVALIVARIRTIEQQQA